MGLSSKKRLCGLADSRECGSGQHPEALRNFAFISIDFHHFFVIFLTQENEHDWYIFISPLFQSGTRVISKILRDKVNCLRLCVYLVQQNKY